MNGPEYLRRKWWRSPRPPKVLTTKLSGNGAARRPKRNSRHALPDWYAAGKDCKASGNQRRERLTRRQI